MSDSSRGFPRLFTYYFPDPIAVGGSGLPLIEINAGLRYL